jgi:molecular chaperone GrpE
MTSGRKPPRSDDGVFYLDDGTSDELAKALAEAERAVSAVEERHAKKTSGEFRAPSFAERKAPSGEIPVPDTSRADELEIKLTVLEQQLNVEKERAAAAEEEIGKVREALLRKAADFENIKKRAEREKNEFVKFALAETFRDVLGVLDNFERALQHANDGTSPADFRSGIEMIARQLADVLKKYGVTPVEADGAHFDPNFHEAVMLQEGTGLPPGSVAEVFQKGYLLNDRLLRPALVKVSSGPATPPTSPAPPATPEPSGE